MLIRLLYGLDGSKDGPMNDGEQDNAGSIAAPVYIYLVPLVVGIVLHFVFPLPFLPGGWLPLAIGLSLSVIGIILNGWSGTTMGKGGTDPHWDKPATVLVIHGPFRFSRNPQYLSVNILYTGIAISFNALWPIVFLPVILVIMTEGVIKREERYLERRFGEEYLSYKARVRRWL
jgi:protein-S-isoprenylcysteine O-methyltransferase Ste14